MRVLLIFFACLFSLYSPAQTPEEDEVLFRSAVDWLDSKLNYLYYDDVGEKWWNNTFYVNDDRVITIKHIASDIPNTGNIKRKTYTIRTFNIQDINPRSLKITEIEETRGRIVKGKMLELRTYGFQDLIHKTINKRKGSSTSFLFLSFPEVLNDSISNYAEIVKQKFEQAILASTQLYPAGDDRDIETVFKVLNGSFETEDGKEWDAEEVKSNVLKIDRGIDAIEYFGFDQENKEFYLLDISSRGTHKKSFQLDNTNDLSLKENEENIFKFHTLHSFSYKGVQFFRQ